MAVLKISKKIQSGLYNFLSDGTVGAVGTINLGVHIPAFAVISGFWVTELTAITGGAGATISFGTITTNSNPVVSTVNDLMTAQVVANFTAQPLMGMDLFATPLRLLVPVDITMSIAVNPLTAGQLSFEIWYSENIHR